MYIPKKKKKKNSKLNSIFWKLFSPSFEYKNKNPPTKQLLTYPFCLLKLTFFTSLKYIN